MLEQGQVVELRGLSASNRIITRVVTPGRTFRLPVLLRAERRRSRVKRPRHFGRRCPGNKFAGVIAKLQSDENLLTEMFFQFCTRLTEAERRLEVLTYRGAKDRLGHLLLDLGHSRGAPVDETADTVRVPMTHDQLAQMSAMSRSHVTVTMVSFRKAGLVQYSRDEPLVIRLSALREYLKR